MTRNPNLPFAAVADPIKVALLTDDPLLRAGVSSLLAQLGSIEVVERDCAEVALWDAGVDPDKTLARLGELRALTMPVVAVVDRSGPRRTGARRRCARGRASRPGRSRHPRRARRGAERAHRDGHGARVEPRPEPADPVKLRSTKGRGELTERERQVVQLLSEGLSNKLIADRLGISDHTAKFHVNGVMMKLGSSTRTEAVVEAMRRGLVRL